MQLFDDQPDLLLAQSGKDCYKTSDKGRYCHRICNMPAATLSQREQLKALVSGKPIIRAQELRNAGIAGSTIQRALDDGDIVRISRGLYQDPQSDVDSAQTLAGVRSEERRVGKEGVAKIK